MADLRITDDEAAILRSWLGGNSPGAIGKARREPEGRIVTVLSRLCGLDRAAGRQVLDSGLRRASAAPSADVDRAALVTERDQLRADLDDAKAERDLLRGQLHDALTSRHELRRQLDELTADARGAAEQRDEALAELHRRPRPPVPLDEYSALRCGVCRWVGVGTHHHAPLQPVTVAILPRQVS